MTTTSITAEELPLLRLPVAHGARLVALGLLDDAASAGARLRLEGAGGAEGDVEDGGVERSAGEPRLEQPLDQGPRDDEALHDFRVAVRRLRSWLRAFDEELAASLRRRDLRRLRRVARATNPGRDLEVQLAWLRGAGEGVVGRRRKEGAAWMAARLSARQESADAALRAAVARDFPPARAALEASLSTFEQQVRPDAARPTLGAAIGARVAPHGVALASALDEVHSVADEEAAHDARIEAKRLRYLIEPVAPEVKAARDLLRQLKSLQDALGVLHDAHVMAHEIAAALAAGPAAAPAAAPATTTARAAPVPRAALLALDARLRRDMRRAFRGVERRWLGGRHRKFDARAEALAEGLRGAPHA